ncbi:MAG: DUF4340 domain-containing protein [Clostridiales bacterium]|nr:DUF4340 domain-containing protein [Clostridiales bacterium]
MSKRKKKNLVSILFLLLALVALIVAYVLVSKKDSNSDEGAEQEEISLITLDTDKISYLWLLNGDTDITFNLKDDIWVSVVDPNRPIKQTYVKNMVNRFRDVSAMRIVNENPEDLGEYGLDNPRIMVEAKEEEEGSRGVIKIGDEAVAHNGYYAMVNDDPKIYILATSYKSAFDRKDIEFTDIETAPSLTTEKITYIEVLTRDGEEFELLFDQDKKYDSVGIFSWFILKPYSKVYPADTDKLTSLLDNYTSFSFASCVEYDSRDLSSYGLEEPYATIRVKYLEDITEKLEEPEVNEETGETIETKTYKEEREFKLLVGNGDDHGNYFVKTDKSNAVYTMAESNINKMLNIDTFNYISKFVSIHNIGHIDKVSITVDGKSYIMEIQREKVKNEEGEEETEETYYFNGSAVEEDDFKGIYQAIIAAKYDAKPIKGTEPSNNKPVITISYHYYENDKTVTTSYLPYDDSFYLVEQEGEFTFLADKRLINDTFAKVVEFQQEDQ